MRKLSIAFLAVLFITACGRETTNTTPIDPYAPPPPVADTYTPDIDYRPASVGGNIHQPQNMNGATITIATLSPNAIPLLQLQGINSEPDPAISDNYLRDRRIWDNARRVERAFNVTIEEYIPRGAVRMQHLLRTSSLAGEAFADIVVSWSELTLAAAVGGWVIPLDEIDLPHSDLLGAQLYTSFAAEGFGNAWALTTSEPDISAFTIGVNLDIIRDIGAPNPVELYHNGQWTWDAMLDIMRTATRDTTGDGEINQWGITTNFQEFLAHMIAANDGMIMADDLSFALDHPNTIETIEFVGMIVDEELWRPNNRRTRNQSGGWNIWFNEFGFGDSSTAFITDTAWLRTRWAVANPNHRNFPDPVPPFDFAVLPLPTGPSNTSGNTWMGGWREGLVLPHGSNFAPESLLAIVEEFFSWAGNDFDMISDAPVTWGDGILISGDNVVRQHNAASRSLFDLSIYMPIAAEWRGPLMSNYHPWREVDIAPAIEVVERLREYVERDVEAFFR